MIRQQAVKKVYLYGRLSNEDANKGESYSIESQRKILTKHAEENGFENFEFVFDDGYSGGDWERPAFCKMIEDAEAGIVSTIIVKDLSRFGRGYLKVGFYQEILFPQLDVRLISVQENLDSQDGENDFTPMINFFNEYYLKSTSRKIRAVQQAKGKAGEKLTVYPKYGYRKDPANKKNWIIDEESAEVVRRIFQMFASGINPAQISAKLTEERILCPSAYKEVNGINKAPQQCKEPCHWHTTTIHKILDTREYLGHTINFKTYSKSFKDNRSRKNPIENQMVFENTHPAIIDVDLWEVVQKMRKHKRRAPRYGNVGLFTGVAYCPDCGEKLYYHTRELWNKDKTKSRLDGSYSCSTYRKQTQYQRLNNQGCTAHYIQEKSLEQLVIEELRELLNFVKAYEDEFVQLVVGKSAALKSNSLSAKKQSIKKIADRINELDGIIERLYGDNVSGKITDERFMKMSAKFEKEQAELNKKIPALHKEFSEIENENANIDRFMQIVRKYTEVEELTLAIVHEFIDRIIVHDPENARGKNRVQRVEIVYNNIGVVPCLEVGA